MESKPVIQPSVESILVEVVRILSNNSDNLHLGANFNRLYEKAANLPLQKHNPLTTAQESSKISRNDDSTNDYLKEILTILQSTVGTQLNVNNYLSSYFRLSGYQLYQGVLMTLRTQIDALLAEVEASSEEVLPATDSAEPPVPEQSYPLSPIDLSVSIEKSIRSSKGILGVFLAKRNTLDCNLKSEPTKAIYYGLKQVEEYLQGIEGTFREVINNPNPARGVYITPNITSLINENPNLSKAEETVPEKTPLQNPKEPGKVRYDRVWMLYRFIDPYNTVTSRGDHYKPKTYKYYLLSRSIDINQVRYEMASMYDAIVNVLSGFMSTAMQGKVEAVESFSEIDVEDDNRKPLIYGSLYPDGFKITIREFFKLKDKTALA